LHHIVAHEGGKPQPISAHDAPNRWSRVIEDNSRNPFAISIGRNNLVLH